MDLKNIIALKGENGLFRIVGGNDKFKLVESMKNQSKKAVNDIHKVIPLEMITIFTLNDEEDISLKKIFKSFRDEDIAGTLIDPKAEPKKIAEYFKTLFPDYDEEQVYPSIISKFIVWYNFLKDRISMQDEDAKPEQEEEK